MPDPTTTTEVATQATVRGVRRRGWIGAMLLAPPVLLTLLLPPVIATGSWVDAGARALAWPTMIAGISLRIWSTLHIGGRKRKELVADGPYAMCRNPLYLGTLLAALSAALFLRSPFVLAGAVLLGSSYRWLTIPEEERYLTGLLGEPYRDYCRRVPRLLPKPWRLRSSVRPVVHWPALWHECRRAAWWVLVPLLSWVLEQIRT